MRIVVDCRAFLGGRVSGVEVAATSLLTTLFSLMPDDEFVLFVNAFSSPEPSLSWARQYDNVRIVRWRIPNIVFNLSLWLFERPRLDRCVGGADVVLMPNINTMAVSRRCPLVVVFHDMSFHHVPWTFSWKRRAWHYIVNPRRLARRAKHIIAVSEATRDDVISTYAIPSQRVSVAHNTIAAQYVPQDRNSHQLLAIKEKYSLPYRFILFLGAMEPRKNIVGLVEGYELYRQTTTDTPLPLIIAGSSGWREREIMARIRTSPYAEDIHRIGFVDTEDMPALYTLATVVTYVSLFEGFGLPVAEAMACGAVVIAGDTTALPEVVGEGGVLVDPERPDDIARALIHVTGDAEYRQILSQRARAQAAKFTHSDGARTVRDILIRVGTPAPHDRRRIRTP